jgi:hypothetical protein
MRRRHAAGKGVMLELNGTALLGNLPPASGDKG